MGSVLDRYISAGEQPKPEQTSPVSILDKYSTNVEAPEEPQVETAASRLGDRLNLLWRFMSQGPYNKEFAIKMANEPGFTRAFLRAGKSVIDLPAAMSKRMGMMAYTPEAKAAPSPLDVPIGDLMLNVVGFPVHVAGSLLEAATGVGSKGGELVSLNEDERSKAILETTANVVGLVAAGATGAMVQEQFAKSAVAQLAKTTTAQQAAQVGKQVAGGALKRAMLRGTAEGIAGGVVAGPIAVADEPDLVFSSMIQGVMFAPLGLAFERLRLVGKKTDGIGASISEQAGLISQIRNLQVVLNDNFVQVMQKLEGLETADGIAQAVLLGMIDRPLSIVPGVTAEGLAKLTQTIDGQKLRSAIFARDDGLFDVAVVKRGGERAVEAFMKTGFLHGETVSFNGRNYEFRSVLKDGRVVIRGVGEKKGIAVPRNEIRRNPSNEQLLYHGTTKLFDEFDLSMAKARPEGVGVFLTNQREQWASDYYALGGDDFFHYKASLEGDIDDHTKYLTHLEAELDDAKTNPAASAYQRSIPTIEKDIAYTRTKLNQAKQNLDLWYEKHTPHVRFETVSMVDIFNTNDTNAPPQHILRKIFDQARAEGFEIPLGRRKSAYLLHEFITGHFNFEPKAFSDFYKKVGIKGIRRHHGPGDEDFEYIIFDSSIIKHGLPQFDIEGQPYGILPDNVKNTIFTDFQSFQDETRVLPTDTAIVDKQIKDLEAELRPMYDELAAAERETRWHDYDLIERGIGDKLKELNKLHDQYLNLNATDTRSFSEVLRAYAKSRGYDDNYLIALEDIISDQLVRELSQDAELRKIFDNRESTLHEELTAQVIKDREYLRIKAVTNNLFFDTEDAGRFTIRDETGRKLTSVNTIREAVEFIDKTGQATGSDLGGNGGLPPRFPGMAFVPEGEPRFNEAPIVINRNNLLEAFSDQLNLGFFKNITHVIDAARAIDKEFGTRLYELVDRGMQVRRRLDEAVRPFIAKLENIMKPIARLTRDRREVIGGYIESINKVADATPVEAKLANDIAATGADITNVMRYLDAVNRAAKEGTPTVTGALDGIIEKLKEEFHMGDAELKAAAILQGSTIAKTIDADVVLGTQIGPQKGTNPGGLWRGTDGVDRYVKWYANAAQALEEMVANKLYSDLGIKVPDSTIIVKEGKVGIANTWIPNDGNLGSKAKITPAQANQILEGFVADVLTINWDAVGTGLDNVIVAKDGTIVRVDQGGAFSHRAQGKLKNTNLYNINEWYSFFTSNTDYGRIFSAAGLAGQSEIASIVKQINNVLKLKDLYGGWENWIKERAPQLGDTPHAKQLAGILESRSFDLEKMKQHLLALGLVDEPSTIIEKPRAQATLPEYRFGTVAKLVRELQRPPVPYAKTHNMTSAEIAAAERLNAFNKELGPETQLLRDAMTHARLYKNGDLEAALDDFGAAQTQKDVILRGFKWQDIDAYEADPFMSTFRFIRSREKAKHMDGFITEAMEAVKNEVKKTGGYEEEASGLMNRFLGDIQGLPSASRKANIELVRRLNKAWGWHLSDDFVHKIVTLIMQTGEAALQGGRIMYAGLRDLLQPMILYQARMGEAAAGRAMKYGINGYEGIKAQHLVEAGEIARYDINTITHAEQFTESVMGRGFNIATRTLNAANKLAFKLSGQGKAYQVAASGIYLERFKTVGDELLRLARNEAPKEVVYKNLKIQTYEPPIIEAFDRLVTAGKYEDATRFIARATVAENVGLFSQGNRMAWQRSEKGRLFWQFGSWPMWFRRHVQQMTTRGTLADRAAYVTRLGAAQAAFVAAAGILGINMYGWYFPPAVAFMGGPSVETAKTLFNATVGRCVEHDLAVARLKNVLPFSDGEFQVPNVWYPGKLVMQDIAEAIEMANRGDSRAIFRMMGYRPIP